MSLLIGIHMVGTARIACPLVVERCCINVVVGAGAADNNHVPGRRQAVLAVDLILAAGRSGRAGPDCGMVLVFSFGEQITRLLAVNVAFSRVVEVISALLAVIFICLGASIWHLKFEGRKVNGTYSERIS